VTCGGGRQEPVGDSVAGGHFAAAETRAKAARGNINPASPDPVFWRCSIDLSCPGKRAKLRGFTARSNLLTAVPTSEKID
jgi:hypothetical protein